MAYYINAFVKHNNNVKHINNGSKKSINSPFFKNIFYLYEFPNSIADYTTSVCSFLQQGIQSSCLSLTNLYQILTDRIALRI